MSQIQRSFLAILTVSATALLLAANPSFTHGLIQSSCAPWDGAAIAITLSPETVQCGRAPSGPYLSLGVWRGLPLHDGQVVKFGSGSDNGYASRCTKENDWLHFKGGETVSGTFEVQWCNTRSICG